MQIETQKQIQWAEHEARWEPLAHDPHGKVTRVPHIPRKQLVAILKTVAGITQAQYAPQGWKNPGPNARWCPTCQDWVMDGTAIIRRSGETAEGASYTAHCPRCEGRITRTC